MVLMDTLRPDHLRAYGYESDTAPFLTALSKKGVVFSEAISSSSWTAPSTASLFVGGYPTFHGVVEGLMANKVRASEAPLPMRIEINRIPTDIPTLPEILRDNGYRTFGVGANPNIGPEIGFSRGFDRFKRVAPTMGLAHASAKQVHAALSGWIPEIRGSDPYFVYLHYNDPHAGYAFASPPTMLKHVREAAPAARVASYDAQIRYLDEWIERSFAALGVAEDTLVVFVSDHGEGMGEHGRIGHGCCSLHGEVNRIAMMWIAPRLGLAARRVDANASIVDVLPTVLDLLEIPAGESLDGRSLLELMRGAESPDQGEWEARSLLAHRAHVKKKLESWAVVRGRHKLIEGEDGLVRLFDVRADPGEQHDLSEQHPDTVESMRSDLDKLRAARRVESETSIGELSVADQERLRALGYVHD